MGLETGIVLGLRTIHTGKNVGLLQQGGAVHHFGSSQGVIAVPEPGFIARSSLYAYFHPSDGQFLYRLGRQRYPSLCWLLLQWDCNPHRPSFVEFLENLVWYTKLLADDTDSKLPELP